jgi:hypothetical protein
VLSCKKPYSNNTDVTAHVFKLHRALKADIRPGPLPREPKEVMTLISNCWKTDPTKRPSAKEVSEELKKIRNQRYHIYNHTN